MPQFWPIFLKLDRNVALMISILILNMSHMVLKTRPWFFYQGKHCSYSYETTCLAQSFWNSVRMIAYSNMGHVGSKLSQYVKNKVKTGFHLRGHSFCLIFPDLCKMFVLMFFGSILNIGVGSVWCVKSKKIFLKYSLGHNLIQIFTSLVLEEYISLTMMMFLSVKMLRMRFFPTFHCPYKSTLTLFEPVGRFCRL